MDEQLVVRELDAQSHHCPSRRFGQAVAAPIRHHCLRQLGARSCQNPTLAIRWTTDGQVPMIIGLLPVLLHVSLAFFFAGLVIFLFSLGMKVAWLISIIGAATFMAYVIALILPLVYPYCPYKVPLTLYVHHLYQYIHHLCRYGNSYLIPSIRYCIVFVRHYPYTHMFWPRTPLLSNQAPANAGSMEAGKGKRIQSLSAKSCPL